MPLLFGVAGLILGVGVPLLDEALGPSQQQQPLLGGRIQAGSTAAATALAVHTMHNSNSVHVNSAGFFGQWPVNEQQ